MKSASLKIVMDTNGNKIVKFTSCTGRRGFSVQTNGNMPSLQRLHVGDIIYPHQSVECWNEFLDYVEEFGTDRQKSFFSFEK